MFGSSRALYIDIVSKSAPVQKFVNIGRNCLVFVITAGCGRDLLVDIFTHLMRNITARLNRNIQNNLEIVLYFALLEKVLNL